MKHIKILAKNRLQDTMLTGTCEKCSASCQSACKTSMTVSNIICYNKTEKK
ncbi:MAG: six-cysteine ranthipeptide SCIFF [Vulcanibacillus sp.]